MALDSASPRKYAAFRAAPHRWFRQYIGIIRGEQRTIYGNFFPRDITPPHLDVALYASRHPVDVCDGGSAFFGVEFDLSSGRYFHIAFNDPI
jgi:hypothetical protein